MSILDYGIKAMDETVSPFFLKLVAVCLLITTAIFAGLVYAAYFFTDFYLQEYDWPSYIETIISFMAGAGAFIFSMFLFPLIFPAVSYLFQDQIVDHLNDKYRKRTASPASFWEALMLGVAFTFKSLLINILFLPFYIIPLLNIVVFFIINSWLLGKEYFYLVMLSEKSTKEIKQIQKRNKSMIFQGGMVIAISFLFPILNLFTPILAVIFFWFLINDGIIEAEETQENYIRR